MKKTRGRKSQATVPLRAHPDPKTHLKGSVFFLSAEVHGPLPLTLTHKCSLTHHLDTKERRCNLPPLSLCNPEMRQSLKADSLPPQNGRPSVRAHLDDGEHPAAVLGDDHLVGEVLELGPELGILQLHTWGTPTPKLKPGNMLSYFKAIGTRDLKKYIYVLKDNLIFYNFPYFLN